MPHLKSKLLKKNKETKKHEVVTVVSLIKVARSLYANTVLFQEHFKDYHFLDYT